MADDQKRGGESLNTIDTMYKGLKKTRSKYAKRDLYKGIKRMEGKRRKEKLQREGTIFL